MRLSYKKLFLGIQHAEMKKATLLCFFIVGGLYATAQKMKRAYFELKIYSYRTEQQQKLLNDYLEKSWMPAMHRAGIENIGVFSPVGNDTATEKKIFILTPYREIEQASQINQLLYEDPVHLQTGESYLNAQWNAAPYERIQILWMQAFEGAPELKTPRLTGEKKENVYELRSYEGPTESYYRNKVDMFNEGKEIPLFERLGFNAVFYGEVIAGSRMPNLMYMTCFENMASREQHWKTFSEDPEWKKLVGMEKYRHNVSKIDIHLLHALPYADY